MTNVVIIHLYLCITDIINAGDSTRGDIERMSTVRALVDAVRKQIEFVFTEDEEVEESVVFREVDSYNMEELVDKNRLHHRQLRVACKQHVQHVTSSKSFSFGPTHLCHKSY